MIGIGVINVVSGAGRRHPTSAGRESRTARRASAFLLLKAFAGGSVALTGTEAIANGVPAFKPPESKNAANTMTAMAILLGVLFVGITFVARRVRDRADRVGDGPTTVSPRRRQRLRRRLVLFYLFQARTALILFLAANTSFNAFPRLAAILAIDGYMPRQFAFRGDRLAFSCGIVAPRRDRGGAPGRLFGGDTPRPDPALLGRRVRLLHAVADRDGSSLVAAPRAGLAVAGWRSTASERSLTAVVLVVVASVKFADGAYLVVILIPLLVGMMLFIQRQYDASRRELAVRPDLVFAAAARGARRRPDPGRQPGRDPGGQRGALDRRRRPRCVHHREPRGRRRPSAIAGSASCPGCRSSSSSRRTGR